VNHLHLHLQPLFSTPLLVSLANLVAVKSPADLEQSSGGLADLDAVPIPLVLLVAVAVAALGGVLIFASGAILGEQVP